jgi:hypothetical protein
VRGAHCAEKIHHTHVTTPTPKGKGVNAWR